MLLCGILDVPDDIDAEAMTAQLIQDLQILTYSLCKLGIYFELGWSAEQELLTYELIFPLIRSPRALPLIL